MKKKIIETGENTVKAIEDEPVEGVLAEKVAKKMGTSIRCSYCNATDCIEKIKDKLWICTNCGRTLKENEFVIKAK